MYSGCSPASHRINIALSFPSPSEPAEEPWKKTRPRHSPGPERLSASGAALPGPRHPSRRLLHIKYSG